MKRDELLKTPVRYEQIETGIGRIKCDGTFGRDIRLICEPAEGEYIAKCINEAEANRTLLERLREKVEGLKWDMDEEGHRNPPLDEVLALIDAEQKGSV